jgi:hypothetical protein
MSTLDLTFLGSVQQILFNNVTIQREGGSPPNTVSSISQVTLYDQVIDWTGSNVPALLTGLTVRDLLTTTIPGVTVSIEGVFEITSGIQTAEDASTPTIEIFTFYGSSTTISQLLTYNVPYCFGGRCPTATITNFEQEFESFGELFEVGVTPWNSCNPSLPGCINQNVDNFSLTFTLNVTLKATCTGSDLLTGLCAAYCNVENAKNLDQCFPPYLNYCFTGDNIFTETQCRTFFENYVTVIGPDAQLDEKLTTYCTTKYPDPGGLEKLRQANNTIDNDLCGCHMQQDQYTNFVNEILQDFNVPGAGTTTFGIQERCLLEQCASSPFKTVAIGKVCNVPACLNILEFNVNGSFNNDKVVINQEDPKCTNVTRKTGGVTPVPPSNGNGNGNGAPQTFEEKNRDALIGIVVFLFIFFIVMGILLVAL